ncbi:phospholipase D-like domain-containing protein [Peribacillus asahii]|uniref:phospholipase D-like domain-containing protein n=1 Tax=Peribacillus asahii TaxID=228899 RepID=UPI002079FF8D|nr:phospholipase D-like domain-containing protein [Peribacillus asahii]USK62315.1 phospholipase D-like domain-containing protein [Peribacillus asahii]
MKKEILFHEGKVIFFKESNLWNDLLERCRRDTKSIYIATYNFNFKDRYERTFYKELSKLADLGVDINLLYAKMTFSNDDKLEIEEIFKNFVLCAKLPTNHSKLFITDDFAFIGSANFSFGSNMNYESGVIFKNKEIISEITKFYCEELLDKSEFTNIPECFDPFEALPGLLGTVEELSKIEKKEDLYIGNIKHNISNLRYLDGLEKVLEKLGYPIPVKFEWWQLYQQLYEEKHVPDNIFHDFKSYLHVLSPYLVDVTTFVNEQYENIGRNELLKRIGVI